MKFRYKLLSVKNWLALSAVAFTWYALINDRTAWVSFLTGVDMVVFGAYFAVNHLQKRQEKGKEL